MTGVDQEPTNEISLLFVLLQVISFGPAEDFPIDVLDVVAGRILAVLGEFDCEAVMRTAMLARQITLDDKPGLQLQAADLGKRDRVEIIEGRFRHFVHIALTKCLSANRSTHARWSDVSGTGTPRAAQMRSKASFEEMPTTMSKLAANMAERPTPARQ